MLALVGAREPIVQSQACLHAKLQPNFPTKPKLSSGLMRQDDRHSYCVLIPGLPDDLAKICLALVPRSYFPVMGAVSKSWMSFIGSQDFITVRKEVRMCEEWIYALTAEPGGKGSHWEVLGVLGQKNRMLPPMPGPTKAGFGVVVLDGKLFVMAGYAADHGKECVSDEVYQYDARLNRWGAVAKMNVARHSFACATVDGVIYAAGGFGPGGEGLCSVEAYDPRRGSWAPVGALRRPRWGCFAGGLGGRFYVMGGRSSFTIGNSRSVDVYDPRRRAWEEAKNGCVMVTSHVALGGRLFCAEWRNQRSLAVFDPATAAGGGAPRQVAVPLAGSSSTRFCLGVLGEKLLLFSHGGGEPTGSMTLTYDPSAPEGSEWGTSGLGPSGLCLCSVTIEV